MNELKSIVRDFVGFSLINLGFKVVTANGGAWFIHGIVQMVNDQEEIDQL